MGSWYKMRAAGAGLCCGGRRVCGGVRRRSGERHCRRRWWTRGVIRCVSAPDMALALGDFAVAEKDYRAYISAAQARGDGNAMLDGTVRLVNLRLQQGDAAGAELEWRQFIAGNGGADPLTGKLLEADIMMVRGDFTGAAEMLSGLLANAGLPESLYTPVAFALGEALMRQGKYIDAVGVYRFSRTGNRTARRSSVRFMRFQSADELIDSPEKNIRILPLRKTLARRTAAGLSC